MKKYKIAIVGVGYIGEALTVAFSKYFKVVAFDINKSRIKELKKGFDRNKEFSEKDVLSKNIVYSYNEKDLKKCDFFIIAVPTPLDKTNSPDLTFFKSASAIIGSVIKKGSIIVSESTSYPGTVEEVCIPILESQSSLICGKDFKIGYASERISPGDLNHNKLDNIVKVVSGIDEGSLDLIASVYSKIVSAGVFKSKSIKVAELSKCLENTQRDVNIGLINQISIICKLLNIDTKDVLEAAGTKWNFLKFSGGLVGGECLSVDPFYLIHKSKELGYLPELILSAREVNDSMSKYIVTEVIKLLVKNNLLQIGSIITILGVTYKENIPSIQVSKVIDIIKELISYGIQVQVIDHLCNEEEIFRKHNIVLTPLNKAIKSKCVILAVSHKEFVESGWDLPKRLLKNESGVVVDIKSTLNIETKPSEIILWRL